MTDHWPLFVEFCKAELATGGPDPQLPTIAWLCNTEPLVERVWLAGCYGAHHCVPSAYRVWEAFRPEEVQEDPGLLENWLQANWDCLPVRPEMRSHRMLDKRVRCLADFAEFALQQQWARHEWTYEGMWAHTQYNIKYFGRYMGIKFMEMLRLMVRPDFVLPNLRAKGAWSPRRTLALLHPQSSHLPNRDDQSEEVLILTEKYAIETRLRLLEEYHVIVSMFQLQVMLCEYREALNGGYYPGASLDEELDYMSQAATNIPEHDPFREIFRARASLFPHSFLGERYGWDGLRKEKFLPFKGEIHE